MNPSALTEYMYVQENETKKFYCETGVDIIDTEMIHFIPESTFWKDIESTHTHKRSHKIGWKKRCFSTRSGEFSQFMEKVLFTTMHKYHALPSAT